MAAGGAADDAEASGVDLQAVGGGQWWRLLTHPFVHVSAWHLLLDASIYILFGLLISGFLRVFLNPNSVVRHLGRGRFSSVFKAAFLGIPIPL